MNKLKTRGLLSFWLVDINKIRRKIDDIERIIRITEMNAVIKNDIATSCRKIMILLNKGKS